MISLTKSFLTIFILVLSIKAYSFDFINTISYLPNKGLLYKQPGNQFDFDQGLPDNFSLLRLYFKNNHYYLTTKRSGIFKRKTSENKWTNIGTDILKRRTTLPNVKEYRKITAFCVSSSNPDKLYIATKHTIYFSKNNGETWTKLSSKGFSSRNYITSLLENNNKLFVGTSANGIYVKINKKFKKISKGLPKEPYSKNLFFYEETSVITKGIQNKEYYAGFLFGKGVYYTKNNGKKWHQLASLPLKSKNYAIYDIEDTKGFLLVSSSEGVFRFNKNTSKWIKEELNINSNTNEIKNSLYFDKFSNSLFIHKTSNQDSLNLKNKNLAALDKKALYTNIWQLKKNLDKLIKTMKAAGQNALVIDTKDDNGKIHIPIPSEIISGIQKRKKTLDIESIIKKLHKEKIYVIARQVVFKDKKLYKAFKNKYAIWDKKKNKAWKGNKHEYWVDPFSEFVRNYNIKIAKETASLGFDEIQFDYIRFPSDGLIYNCKYRFKKDQDSFKSEILADFLEKASTEISAPISVDIYGFNGCYRFGNTIGQDIDVYARFADVICPMVYPSHYGTRYLKKGPRAKRPYRIVYSSGIRALYLSEYQAIIRPYIQAFNYISPTWGVEYIRYQVKAVKDSGCSGYIFWNAAGEYKMVKKALSSK